MTVFRKNKKLIDDPPYDFPQLIAAGSYELCPPPDEIFQKKNSSTFHHTKNRQLIAAGCYEFFSKFVPGAAPFGKTWENNFFYFANSQDRRLHGLSFFRHVTIFPNNVHSGVYLQVTDGKKFLACKKATAYGGNLTLRVCKIKKIIFPSFPKRSCSGHKF